VLHLALHNGLQVQHFDGIVKHVLTIKSFEAFANDGGGNALCFSDGVDVLDLDKGFQVFLKHPCEEGLELGATEVFQHSFPVWGVLEYAQVRAHVTSQNSQGGRFADTVLTDKTEDLAKAGCGKPVELEGVGTVSVSGLTFKTLGQIDDPDRVVRADLNAETATNAE